MPKKRITIALIGNPNSGKSTLFNTLTGDQQQIGNWPGVTVERKSGFFTIDEYQIELVDLPGIYSLSIPHEKTAIDEKIAYEYLLSEHTDLIINVIDADNLERNLYLTLQLSELNIPTIIALNMNDIAIKHGIEIDINKLSTLTECTAINLIAHKNTGINELKTAIIAIVKKNYEPINTHITSINYPLPIANALDDLIKTINNPQPKFIAIRLLDNDTLAAQHVSPATNKLAEQYRNQINNEYQEDADILIADARYSTCHKIAQQVTTKHPTKSQNVTNLIDRLVLNRILGIPIFLLIMYLSFFFTIKFGGYLQNIFQSASNVIFVESFGNLLVKFHTTPWIANILTNGIGKGINATITFIPVLTITFFCLALLETSGYIARASFVVDRLMSAIGLPGKAFLPMLIGFGCNVPAIMATRTLENPRDRILTIVMSPFMSCGARLAIYAVFTAAFFSKDGQNIVFLLYIIGILTAIGTGLILRKTILQGQQSHLVMELPHYHIPKLKHITKQTWLRLESFLYKAGTVIIPLCLLISILNTITITNKYSSTSYSALEVAGREITPLFKPMGIQENNWPAVVGLVTGVATKEVIVATLNTLYTQKGITTNIYGKMYQKFSGKTGAFAYLLFILLYLPCVPTLITIWRELNWRWSVFSACWNTILAYCIATAFYQIANII